jgi:hypothetical protein
MTTIADRLRKTTNKVKTAGARKEAKERAAKEREEKLHWKRVEKRLTTEWKEKAKMASVRGEDSISLDVPGHLPYANRERLEKFFAKQGFWTEWPCHIWYDDDGNEFSDYSLKIGWGTKPKPGY